MARFEDRIIDIKISKKINRGFTLVTTLFILGIIALIFSYLMSNDRLNNLIDNAVTPEVTIGDASDAILSERVAAEQLIIFKNGTEDYKTVEATYEEQHKKAVALIDQYVKVSPSNESEAIVKGGSQIANDLKAYYDGEYSDYINGLVSLAKQNKEAEAVQLISSSRDVVTTMDNHLNNASDIIDARIEYYIGNAEFGMVRLFIISAITFVLLMILVISILKYLNKNISKRIEKLTDAADDLAIGDVDVDIVCDSKDEIGQLSESFLTIVNGFKKQSETISAIAGGDLTVNISPRSEVDTVNIELQKMIESLNHMVAQITASSANVFSGSKQIDKGAQLLAQGSSEQSSSVEELSSAMDGVAFLARDNNAKAKEASQLVDTIEQSSKAGSEQMERMERAVNDISIASQDINVVINTIESIAFQTNILALNAAVEAARAGQHGKGFAVVADEVRNLAAKSAEAASTTNALIKNTIEKAESGTQIANETVKSFEEIASGISDSAKLLNDIADLSNKQNMSIEQIKITIDQVAQVVEQNSSTSEESAASSQELTNQAEMLESLSNKFRINK